MPIKTLSDKRVLSELTEFKDFVTCEDVKQSVNNLEKELFDWCGGIDENIEDCDTVRSILIKHFGEKLL